MKVTATGVSRKDVALIRKTLRANPGATLRGQRGEDGRTKYRLHRSRLTALKRHVALSELRLEAESRYRRAVGSGR